MIFPESVKVGILKKFIEVYEPTTECPVEFLWSGCATAFGALCSPYAQRRKIQPRLYTCNVGISGSTRKSTGASAAIERFHEALTANKLDPSGENLVEDNRHINFLKGFGSAEGLLNALRNPDRIGVPCLQYLDELEILFRKIGISGSAGVGPFHQLFDGNVYDHVLKGESLSVDSAYLAVVANSTVDRFKMSWTAEHIDSGFFNRWMLVLAVPVEGLRLADPPDPSPAGIEEIDNWLRANVSELMRHKLTEKGQKPMQIKFSSDAAFRRWEKYYCKDLDPKNSLHTRLDTIADRLMIILSLAQAEYEITEATVDAVCEFCEYQKIVRLRLAPILGENPKAKMISLIGRLLQSLEPKQYLHHRDLYRAAHADRWGPALFNEAIREMLEADQIKTGTTSKHYRWNWVGTP